MEDWSKVVAESCGSALLLGLRLGEMSQAQMGSSPENQHLEPFSLQPDEYRAPRPWQAKEQFYEEAREQ